MIKSRCLITRLGLCLLAVCLFLLTVGCGQSGVLPFESKQSFTSTFGFYQFDEEEAVKDFNLQVTKWFLERGFVDVKAITYCDIVGTPNEGWDKPGVLLLSNRNPQNLIYVFVPDFYDPERNIQMIGYHGKLKGSNKEVRGYQDDFDRLRDDFRKEFSMFGQPIPDRDSLSPANQ